MASQKSIDHNMTPELQHVADYNVMASVDNVIPYKHQSADLDPSVTSLPQLHSTTPPQQSAGHNMEPSLHQLQHSTKYKSLSSMMHKDILSPLAKGVQSVPVIARNPDQVNNFADTGYVKPHESKAELSLINITLPMDQSQMRVKVAQKVERKDQATPDVPVAQGASDVPSNELEEPVSALADQMQSLSLSALDQQMSCSKRSESMKNATKIVNRGTTLSDTTLVMVEKKGQQQGRTQSRSLSFLKMSRAKLKILAFKSCTSRLDYDSSSDEMMSYKSSLDETANGRSDKENIAKRKKKPKKKKKMGMRKNGFGTGSETSKQHDDLSETHIQQDSQKTDQISSADVSQVSMVTGNVSLEWDHYDNTCDFMDSSTKTVIPSGTDVDLGRPRMADESPSSNPTGNIQYHKDILAIFQQVEKEGGPKLAMINEDNVGLQITILHLHRKKEDLQKLLKVTQEHLWDSRAEIKSLHSQLADMNIQQQNSYMTQMKMEVQVNESTNQLLHERTELGTKITDLEREIERLTERLREQTTVAVATSYQDATVQTLSIPQPKRCRNNGLEAELKVLVFQNSQLHWKFDSVNKELEKQRFISQSFRQFAEYLKIKFLNFEECLITEKQHAQKLIEMVSSTNSKPVTNIGSGPSISICKAVAEFGNIPEDDDPIIEVKNHIIFIQKIMEAVATETEHLRDAIKINLEEKRLMEIEESNLNEELESLRSEQNLCLNQLVISQDKVKTLEHQCQLLCEDNEKLEEICVQHAKELNEEKDKMVKVVNEGRDSQLTCGQLIKEHIQQQDTLKQQLLQTQEECNQAKKNVTENIQQISTLQKKCSELISTEQRLRKELEETKEQSQHAMGQLLVAEVLKMQNENESQAIASLQQQNSKVSANKQEHKAELMKQIEHICNSFKLTTTHDMELLQHRHDMEMGKKLIEHCHDLKMRKMEMENTKEMGFALSETRRQLEDAKEALEYSKDQAIELQKQCLEAENEKKQQHLDMQREMDNLRADLIQHTAQSQHDKRFVEELQYMVKKQEKEHDDVLAELLQRNIEHQQGLEQVHQSTECIKELQSEYKCVNEEKEHLRGVLESQVHSLQMENHQLTTQLQDSQLLVKEQHAKCHKLSEESIQQISTLQKKCSELISTEQRLRKELEETKEQSQHAIGQLEDNQALAIASLQQQTSKVTANKQEHEAELMKVKRALENVCNSFKLTATQNVALMQHRHDLETGKREHEATLREMGFALSETRQQLEVAKAALEQSKDQAMELQKQCLVAENEKKQHHAEMQREMDNLRTDLVQHAAKFQHNKRLVEELQLMVKKQEKEHDDVLAELLQRNVEHQQAVEQVHESTKCIKELQSEYKHINEEKERLRGVLETQVHSLQMENHQLTIQLQDSQLLVKEQHAKCHKLSEDLKSATSELTKRDHTIETIRHQLAASLEMQKKEFESKSEQSAIARASLEGRLCQSECSEKELRSSKESLKAQLAVLMENVKLLERERSKNSGLEQNLQAIEAQLRESNKSIELSSSTSLHQASEIKTLSDVVNTTRNQLKELIEDNMHSAHLLQLQEKQSLTNQLTEALSIIDNYDQRKKQDSEVQQSLALENQHLQEKCASLTSLFEEEKARHRNSISKLQEISAKLAMENKDKLMLQQEKEKLLDWNQNIFNRAGSLTSTVSSVSTGQSSELLQLKESSGQLASDIQLVLRLSSNSQADNNYGKPGHLTNSFGIFATNTGHQQP